MGAPHESHHAALAAATIPAQLKIIQLSIICSVRLRSPRGPSGSNAAPIRASRTHSLHAAMTVHSNIKIMCSGDCSDDTSTLDERDPSFPAGHGQYLPAVWEGLIPTPSAGASHTYVSDTRPCCRLKQPCYEETPTVGDDGAGLGRHLELHRQVDSLESYI